MSDFPTLPPELRAFNNMVAQQGLPDRCNIRRKVQETVIEGDANLPPNVPPTYGPAPGTGADGMGGFIYRTTQTSNEHSERTVVHSDVPCRISLPRANKASAEDITSSVYETQTRFVVTFADGTDIFAQDEVEITLMNGVTYSSQERIAEVKLVDAHTEGFTLRVDCVLLT